MKESIIQRRIMNFLEELESKYNVYWFRSGSGQFRVGNRYFKTGRPGCPDICVVIKGKFIGIEVKSESGRQTENQHDAETAINMAGGQYYVVRSVDEVKTIIGRAMK